LASKRTKHLPAALTAVIALAAGSCVGRRTSAPLERIDQVAALPFQVGEHRVPVHLKGWVTLSDPTTNLIFLEDGTGAARVSLPFLNIDLRTRNMVEIVGEVTEGGSAPTIAASEVKLLQGVHELEAQPVQVADVTAGRTGFHYVAVEGVFRSRHQDRSGGVVIRVGSGTTVFEAYIAAIDLPNLAGKIGARIRVRAVANLSRDIYGRTAKVQVWIPRSTDFEVLVPAPQALPVQTIRAVAALPPSSTAERMVHLRGAVQSDGLREGLRLSDDSGSIRIRQAPTQSLPIGETIDLTGFPELEGGELKITDARVSRTSLPHPEGDRVITSVAEVHSLTPEEAAGAIPVHARATITYINPTSNTFFVQDASGPVYVNAPRIREIQAKAGDLVELSGATAPGQFAPIISNGWAERISSSAMPAPAPVGFDDLFSGKMDSAWVRTEGVIERIDARRPTLEDTVSLQWGEHQYQLLVHNPDARALPSPDSRVWVEGVCGSVFNAKRQIVGIQIYVPSPAYVHLLEPGPDPKTLKSRPIDELLRFSFADFPDHRSRVRGIVGQSLRTIVRGRRRRRRQSGGPCTSGSATRGCGRCTGFRAPRILQPGNA